MILILEQDPGERLFLHQQWQNNVTTNNLITVANSSELLHVLATVKPSVICVGTEDQWVIPLVRTLPACENVPIFILASSSIQIDKSITKQHNARYILKPLRAYQLREITERYLHPVTMG